jgi:hypothetical protein
MRRRIAALVLASTAVVATGGLSTAGAEESAGSSRIWITHGLPLDDAGTVVDVFAGPAGAGPAAAAPLIDDFRFGATVGPVELPAASYTVSVAAPSADDDGTLAPSEVVFSQDVTVPSGRTLSAVASLSATGQPVIAVFSDDLAPTGEDGRISVRHAAAAPPVQLDATEPTAPWTWLGFWAPLANGQQLDLVLSAGAYDLLLSVYDPVDPVPFRSVDDFPVAGATLTRVYAVGDPAAGTFQFLVTTVTP